MGILSWFQRWFGQDGSNRAMLLQFRGAMQAILASVPADESYPANVTELLKQAKTLCDVNEESFTWQKAYQLEQILAQIRPAAALEFELESQAGALKGVDADIHARYLAQIADLKKLRPAGGLAETELPFGWKDSYTISQRALLGRVLNDVHWKYAQRYHNRIILEKYTRTIFWFSILIALVFFGALIAGGKTNWAVLSPYSGIALAVSAGLVGASFSILTGGTIPVNGTSMEEMRLRTGVPFMLLRIGVGGLAAVILYFFFESGMLGGELLPDLNALGFSRIALDEGDIAKLAKALEIPEGSAISAQIAQELGKEAVRNEIAAGAVENLTSLGASGFLFEDPLGGLVPNSDLSKLLVWSFAAGFSEKLVQSVLGRVQKQTEGT